MLFSFAYIEISFHQLIFSGSVSTFCQIQMKSNHALHILNPLMHIFAGGLFRLLSSLPILPLYFIHLQNIFAVFHLHVFPVTLWKIVQISEQTLKLSVSVQELLKPLKLHFNVLVELQSTYIMLYFVAYILPSKSLFSCSWRFISIFLM